MVVYEMLAGQRPFAAPTAIEVMLLQMQAPAPLLKEHCPELDEELLAFVHRMLAKAPHERPTMAAVARQLGAERPDKVPAAQAAGSSPVPSTLDEVNPAPLTPLGRGKRPRRALWALLGLGSLLPVLIGSVVFLRKRDLHGTPITPAAVEARAPRPPASVPPRSISAVAVAPRAESPPAPPEPRPVVQPQKAPQVRRPAVRTPVSPMPPVLFKNKDPDGF